MTESTGDERKRPRRGRRAGARSAKSDRARREDDALELLRQYVRIDTTNPPGNEGPAAELLESALSHSAVECKVFKAPDGRPNLVARIAADEKRRKTPGTARGRSDPPSGPLQAGALCLMHHMDVVPADESRWSRDPFGGEIADGALWGRGALDMKSLGVMHLFAFLEVASAVESGAASLVRDLLFVAVSDEEEGGRSGAEWLVSHHPEAIDCTELWTEGGYGVANVLQGIDVFACGVAEKSVVWIRATAMGTPGHGGIPPDDQAIEKLVSFVETLRRRNRRYRMVDEVRALYRSLAERARGPEKAALTLATSPGASGPLLPLVARRLGPAQRALLADLVTVTKLDAGYKENVVPGEAQAWLDCRLLPDVDIDSFVEECRELGTRYGVEVEVMYKDSCGGVSPKGPLYYALQRACLDSVPDAAFLSSISPGFTDSRHWRRLGTSCMGLVPVLTDQALLGTIHGDDERIPIEEFYRGLAITKAVVRELVLEPVGEG